MQHHQYYTDTEEPLTNARRRAVAIAAEHEAHEHGGGEGPLSEAIAKRAYELYVEEGFPEGSGTKWFQ